MTHPELKTRLTQLFTDTGHAHHAAFIETDGADPDWPIWYAEHLQEPLSKELDTEFYKSQLIYCLMTADFEREARAPNTAWPEFYADEFIERYAPAKAPAKDELVLYQLPTCPFCKLVRSAIERLGLRVELRDVGDDREAREELMEARGRATVPVLHITSPDGNERWMPESRDIVRYLEKTYAN